MPRPLLLIVDGESQRTPGLVAAMEGDGWAVRCVRSGEAHAFLDTGLSPELVLLDSPMPGTPAYPFVQALRDRAPRVPVLVLSEAGPASPAAQPLLEVQGVLERTQPDGAIASAVRRYRPEGVKLTTDDIFGDLLADLERDAPLDVPPPPDPFALPAEREPLGAADLFSGAAPLATPERSNLPLPTVTVAPTMPTDGSGAHPVEPLGPSDFTLSGISGVHDPFDWSGPHPAAGGAPAAPSPVAPATSDALEEYGNYFLLEKIAVGGMAELFKAQQRGVQGFQKIVAIKRILPHFSDNEDFVTMFIDEAKLAAQLTHPNIVQIFDLGKAGSSYYIAMEYVNGRDLRTLLRKVREYGTAFPEQVAAFVVMKVAAALDYAHRKRGFDDRELKLVHRDISPQNVILSTDGAVKLVDFGIAKAASKASHTVAGALKGKLLYMSPEQATGQPLDNRSDLYSLGLVLFELLTGERCFQADSELGVLEKVRLGRTSDLLTLNPGVSKEMAAIVARALQKGVDHRYPSARFMERDLRDHLQRHGSPITEHDVAEYMQVLLGGTRESLEALVAARFPAPTSSVGLAPLPKPQTERNSPPTATSFPQGLPDLETLGAPPEPEAALLAPKRPRWLLPAILGLAVIVVIMLVIASRS